MSLFSGIYLETPLNILAIILNLSIRCQRDHCPIIDIIPLRTLALCVQSSLPGTEMLLSATGLWVSGSRAIPRSTCMRGKFPQWSCTFLVCAHAIPVNVVPLLECKFRFWIIVVGTCKSTATMILRSGSALFCGSLPPGLRFEGILLDVQ